MTDFSNLTKLALAPERTARYPIYQLEGEPVLLVASATETNKPYFNKRLQRSNGTARRFRAAGMNTGMIEEHRESDRELYAKFVIRGWENMKDATGALVPFSAQVCEEFLRALPAWVFDDLRAFCDDPNNFIDKDSKSSDEAAATAKN